MNSILDSLNKGTLIRGIMAALFRIIGILIFVGVVYLFFSTISNAPDFWFVLLLLFVLSASFLIAQAWFYHAKKIINFEDSDYSVIPIVSNLFRALGETYAIFATAVGVGGILMDWFSNYAGAMYDFTRYLYFLPLSGLMPYGGGRFIYGIIFLITCLVTAYLILLIAYFLAENVLVLVDIAKNTKMMRGEKREEKAV
jgi:hypothetical protein